MQAVEVTSRPELRNGSGCWGFKGEVDHSQDNKNNSYLVIRCCPAVAVGHSGENFSGNTALFEPGPLWIFFYVGKGEVKDFPESAGS